MKPSISMPFKNLNTVLFADMAPLDSNQRNQSANQRYQKVCNVLSDNEQPPSRRPDSIDLGPGYTLVFDAAPIGMAIVSLDGVCHRSNDALTKILGQRVHDFRNSGNESLEDLFAAIQQQFQTENRPTDPVSDIYQGQHNIRDDRDGVVHVDVTAKLTAADGESPPYYLVYVADITERVRMEAENALKETRMNSALNSLEVGFAMYDADEKLITLNENYMDRWPLTRAILERGGTMEDVLRSNVSTGQLTEAQGREEDYLEERLALYRSSKKIRVQLFGDGTWHRIHTVRTPEGEIAVSLIDVTPQKEIEEQLRQALVNAEIANQAKSEFLATMSHEFRTPLNAILGFSEMLQGQYFGPLGAKNYEDYAFDIHSSGEHMLSLVNDLLDISEIEAGKRFFEPESLDLIPVAQTALQSLGPKANENQITLELKFDSPLPTVCADRRSVLQILQNLLSNAIKFSDPGGAVITTLRSTDHGVELVVEDSGAGIPADRLEVITQPFTRSYRDPHIAQDGWGLGLSIVSSLVEEHDGSLTFESELGKGTSVTVGLPFRGPMAQDAVNVES